MNDPYTPAVAVALSIINRWPELAQVTAQAVALVETGQVHHHSEMPGWYEVGPIREVVVTRRNGTFGCSCPVYSNGVVGWYPPYPEVVELQPGHSQIICPHTLAVYISLVIQAEAAELPDLDDPMFTPILHSEAGR